MIIRSAIYLFLYLIDFKQLLVWEHRFLTACFPVINTRQKTLEPSDKLREVTGPVMFCWSPVKDQIQSQKTYHSKSLQDFGPIKIHFWPLVPLYWQRCTKACHCYPTKRKPQASAKHRWVDKCMVVVAEKQAAMCQSPLCFVGFTADLKVTSWSETNLPQPLRTDYQWCEFQLFMLCSQS